jgi:hypothetical protein
MKMDEQVWVDIAEQAIRDAEKIRCPLAEFSEGLDVMMQVFRERQTTLADELDAQENDEADGENPD